MSFSFLTTNFLYLVSGVCCYAALLVLLFILLFFFETNPLMLAENEGLQNEGQRSIIDYIRLENTGPSWLKLWD